MSSPEYDCSESSDEREMSDELDSSCSDDETPLREIVSCSAELRTTRPPYYTISNIHTTKNRVRIIGIRISAFFIVCNFMC